MVDQAILRPPASDANLDNPLTREEIRRDFQICCISREVSLLGRREVLTGKAKFGILGDGKEVPQVAMARAFRRGDFRSGYYRDQTFIFALGLLSVEDYFAQLYADPNGDPSSGGRQMNAHFATPFIDPATGEWIDQRNQYNVSSDLSSTGGQMARGLGLALASKKYRENAQLQDTPFSDKGQEVTFCTIGDASTSEGVFWETVNAAAVMQVPLAVFVWDDGYGISVPTRYQTAKGSISEALAGMHTEEEGTGMRIRVQPGWDYMSLVELFREEIERTRDTHQPILFHVTELTQPQGHSTSGSHERYKSKERLQWEKEHDCIERMAQWMVEQGHATEEEIKQMRKEAKTYVKACRDRAWKAFNVNAQNRLQQLQEIYDRLDAGNDERVSELQKELQMHSHILLSEVTQNARRLYFHLRSRRHEQADGLQQWLEDVYDEARDNYERYLHSDSRRAALQVAEVKPRFSDESEKINGYEVLNRFFDQALEKYPELYAFGEDLGQIGGVNQGFSGLQEKYGESRVFDTGIREWTIMGQAIGMAMRGLRPIGEIQYLDYLIYGLEPLMDDLATLRWRSDNLQQAPAIIRTRGHRLEGIWHAGSPLGMMINSMRGIYICVPRNMVQAAGMYNTLLQSDDPGLVVECLNGYRLKEQVPDNLGEYTIPLGRPETLRQGRDLTIVSYGSTLRVAEEACEQLEAFGIDAELIDVQTLLPFDLNGHIVDSIRKTSRVIFLDEDVPGGATAYMLQQVLEVQGGYRLLDSQPMTVTAKAHRPPFGSDGDYFTKPNPEDVFEAAYRLMQEAEPGRFPAL